MMVISGEPLIFIEVALLKDVAKSIQVNYFGIIYSLLLTYNFQSTHIYNFVGNQEVLWDDPPIPECEATCALFYSISSTQVSLMFNFPKNCFLNFSFLISENSICIYYRVLDVT